MKRLLVFVPVDNDREIDRSVLESLTDKEVWEMLPANSQVYDLDKKVSPQGFAGMMDFVTDYNDEIFDGGWWSTVLELDDDVVMNK